MAVIIGGRQFWLWRAVDDEAFFAPLHNRAREAVKSLSPFGVRYVYACDPNA
jgi:hypothetical protein